MLIQYMKPEVTLPSSATATHAPGVGFMDGTLTPAGTSRISAEAMRMEAEAGSG